jgi:hypothetical protein
MVSLPNYGFVDAIEPPGCMQEGFG